MYRIHLDEFEGPLDLLLFFIKRDELDIFDIPIARIADEFLAYVRVLELVDLDRAGEFIYMAALLIEIKLRMMLPRPADEDGEEVDPRLELVQRLLDYQRFKEAARSLEGLHADRSLLHSRETPIHPAGGLVEEEPVYRTSLFQMISALKRILKQATESEMHRVAAVMYDVDAQRAFVLSSLGRDAVSFSGLVQHRPKLFIIVTFLAILELVRQGLVKVLPRLSEYDFFIERAQVIRDSQGPAPGVGGGPGAGG